MRTLVAFLCVVAMLGLVGCSPTQTEEPGVYSVQIVPEDRSAFRVGETIGIRYTCVSGCDKLPTSGGHAPNAYVFLTPDGLPAHRASVTLFPGLAMRSYPDSYPWKVVGQPGQYYITVSTAWNYSIDSDGITGISRKFQIVE